MEQLLLFPACVPAEAEAALLSLGERREVLEVLLMGGGPQVACGRLGLRVEAFTRTLREDDAFRRQLDAVRGLMTQNVIATVYAAAIKGTAPAQSLWLKTFPPLGGKGGGAGDGEAEEVSRGMTDDDIERLGERDLWDWLALQASGRRVGGEKRES